MYIGKRLKPLHVRRLRLLARYLRTKVDPKRFNLSCWMNESSDPACGTVGCAVGHAASIPSFKRDGYKLREIPRYTPEQRLRWEPQYKKLLGSDAAEAFFGITDRETRVATWPAPLNLFRALFMPEYYPNDATAEMVAERIDQVLDPKCEVCTWPSVLANP